MSKRRHTAEQIIGKLREAEFQLAQGRTVQDASRFRDPIFTPKAHIVLLT